LAAYPYANHLFQYLIDKAAYKETETSFRYQCVKLQKGDVLVGRDSLSANTGVSRQSVRTCLNYLKSTNRITIRSTNRYSIISILKWDTYQGDNTEINQQDNQQTNQHPTSIQPATNHIEEVKKLKKVKKNPSAYTPEFSSFWEAYPKHIGKQVAFESYQRVVPTYPAEDVIAAAKEYAQKCAHDKTEEKFILHPSTFLNKDRWKDYCFEKEVVCPQ